MLTKAEGLFEVSLGRVIPDKLRRKSDGHYLALAKEMLAIYQAGAGKTRDELHDAVEKLFWSENPCPPKRVKAFCKLLDDASEYEEKRSGEIAALRMRVFSLAAARHPIVRHATMLLASREEAVKEEIATHLNRPWSDIEADLFSDVYELQRLRRFEGYESPGALLVRYNEAQIQAALYGATGMRVTAGRDYKAIVMAAKRAMLLHEAERLPDDRFRFTFYGPASQLRSTRRYGVCLARMIPTLLACRDWELSAPVRCYKAGKQPELVITSRDQYGSSIKALAEYDSGVEKDFAEQWGPEPREGWILRRESEPLFAAQKAFFPDFTFIHRSGRRVLMEIAGHWTPEYLESKRETLLQFRGSPLILAVAHKHAEFFSGCASQVVPFKNSLKAEPVLAALAAFEAPPRGEQL